MASAERAGAARALQGVSRRDRVSADRLSVPRAVCRRSTAARTQPVARHFRRSARAAKPRLVGRVDSRLRCSRRPAVGITTAGHDLDSLCGELFQYGKRVAAGEQDDPTFGFYWWQADDDVAVDDPAGWEAANPNLAEQLLDREDLEVASRQTQELAFRRYRLNQWTRTTESWLPIGAWDACTDPEAELVPREPTWVGIDMALKHDSIAVVAVQKNDDGKFVAEAQIWLPDGNMIDVAVVENHIRDLHQRYECVELCYDPAFFERSAQALADEGLAMVEFPQSSQRMVPACQRAYEIICAGSITHAGSPIFSDQVLSAAPRQTNGRLATVERQSETENRRSDRARHGARPS